MNTEAVDTYVQTCLQDHGISPWRRARMAADRIQAVVLAEEGLPEDQHLEVPLEWEHRIPAQVVPSITTLHGAKIVSATLVPEVNPDLGAFPITLVEPEPRHGQPMNGEPSPMTEAFNFLYDEDEAAAQERIDKFFSEDPT